MTIRAILFDVGGPLNTEIAHERLIDADIRASVAAAGGSVTQAEYEAAVHHAVHSHAPDAHAAIIWHLVGDPSRAAHCFADFQRRVAGRNVFELRDGIHDVLEWLHGRGLKLGLAANQPHRTIAVLDRHGIGGFFDHRKVSGTHGYRKPDVRLFLRACDDLGVEPAACIMVGDRIDNDIASANRLGMRTILFRSGRHAEQRPRSHEDVPDAEVRDVVALKRALGELLGSEGHDRSDDACRSVTRGRGLGRGRLRQPTTRSSRPTRARGARHPS